MKKGFKFQINREPETSQPLENPVYELFRVHECECGETIPVKEEMTFTEDELIKLRDLFDKVVSDVVK